MQTIIVPDWLYWLIPRACLVVGLAALLVVDGREVAPALLSVSYGLAVLAARTLFR